MVSLIYKDSKTAKNFFESLVWYEFAIHVCHRQSKGTNFSELPSEPSDVKPFILQARDKGASSWLNAMPIGELDFQLNKEEFRDALRLRSNMKLDNLPTYCPCGS